MVFFGGPQANLSDYVKILSPSGAVYFGRNTPRIAGDFNGDGNNDLIHYVSGTKTIYIYFGSTDFDTFYDFYIHDTIFNGGHISMDFVGSLIESNQTDILITSLKDDKYNYYGYSSNAFKEQGCDYVLKNFYFASGKSFASGDFNNDGNNEIFAGSHYDRNHGSPGGQINLYDTLKIYVGENNLKPDLKLINLFPNPVTSNMTVSFYSNEKESISISVLDITGAVQFKDRYSSVKTGLNNIIIYSSDLKPGVYLLQIQQKTFIKRLKFIVVQ